MDFKDWRKARDKPNTGPEPPRVNKFHGRRYRDYIEEQIAEARERGEFDNLQGPGLWPAQESRLRTCGDRACQGDSHRFRACRCKAGESSPTWPHVTRSSFASICQREASLQ